MRLIDADALINSTDKESVHMYQIALAPTVDPYKHGHWEVSPTGWVYCSVCNEEPPNETNIRSKYCPNCGAEMDERET